MPDESRVNALLRTLWERNRPLMLERLATLDQAAAALAGGAMTPELQEEVESIAHKLAGSLGMFGLGRGTELARELEGMLAGGAMDAGRFGWLVTELRMVMFP